MKKISALIIEDEINVKEGFIKLLNTFKPEVEILDTADSVEEGIKMVDRYEFDLLFLDINLPDGSGFDVIHRVSNKDFQLIFVTAYDKYAVDAFKLSAIDYLMKPVAPDLLIKAIDKAKMYSNKLSKSQADAAYQIYQEKDQSNKIILKDQESIYIIKIAEIICCSADGSYTLFETTKGQSIVTSLNLKEYDTILSDYQFVRCHHSHLVNLSHITEVKKAEGGSLIMSNGTIIPISSRKKVAIMEKIRNTSIN